MDSADRLPPPPTVRPPTIRGHQLPWGALALAAVAYVPLLLTKPGMVGADTKSYLYLDPGRLLSRSAYMWDTNIGLGTVTHQNIGYLWPMGPYYWLMEAVGVPDWVAQRLWLGSIILAAGLGMRFMLRELRWERSGVTVASFAYALSPYLLPLGARISVILLPFAGLPWLIGLTSRSVRSGGWRAPAAFALVTLTVGGVNATSLLLVMVAPVLWMAHVTFVQKEAGIRQVLAAGLRITVLTLITSFWWVAGLVLQGTYGIPILRYTETYFVVANAALAPELLRGLGYWFVYGRDQLGAWILPAIRMVQSIPFLALSFLLPILAFASGLLTRFRHRGFFALVTVTGLVMGVGSHPWDSPSPAGALFKAWTRSDSGLAFRSTPRAVPLIALGLAVFLGAGAAALSRWRPAWHLPVAGGLLVLICLNQMALFRGEMVDRNLLRESEVPAYWTEAATALDSGDRDTRVYEMPGSDFASYRWGNTVDPITPGLMDRDFAARELIPYGTPASANLLNDWDLPLQEGRFDPDTVSPIARLLGVGEIVHRGDLRYERFRTPRPRSTFADLLRAPGLAEPRAFGPPVADTPAADMPLADAKEFANSPGTVDPPAVSTFAVEDPRPMLRTVDAGAPMVLAGNGSGVVSMASAGMIQVDRPLLYAATLVSHSGALARTLAEPDSELVVTDTNRRQARRWGSVRENDGYTEMAGETPLDRDPADNRLDLFPGVGDGSFTVSEQVSATGGPTTVTARASSYGNPVSYTPSDRAASAVDGDPATAWKVGAFGPAEGEYLDLRFSQPVTTDHLTLLQSLRRGNRWMTGVTLTFSSTGGDGTSSTVDVDLAEASLSLPGQRIDFGSRTFDRLRITVDSTNLGPLTSFGGISDVGIAEVTVPGVDPTLEVIRPPTDLLETAGDLSLERALTYLFSRRSADPADLVAEDEERSMSRWVEGPEARAFTPYGKARLSSHVPDERVDELIGMASAAQGGLTANSQARLDGDFRSRAGAAVDGDDGTAWQTPVNGALGNWIEITYPEAVSFETLPISLVTDGRHSVPTRLSLSVDGGTGPTLDLGAVDVGEDRDRGATTTVQVPLGDGPVTGRTFRFTIDAIHEVTSTEWFGGSRTVLPAGIAELGLPVTQPPPAPDTPIPSPCRPDLVTIGGTPVPMRLVGTVQEALDRQMLRLEACGEVTQIPGGRTLLRTTGGRVSGIDVDLLALASAAGGGPGTDTLAEPPGPGPTPPSTETSRPGRLSYEVTVSDASHPYWVVLGQSLSPGWRASVSGHDLGEPTLINGFANGWLVDPAEVGADATISLRWTPQRLVWLGLGASALGVLICLALILRPVRFLAGTRVAADLIGTMDVQGIDPLAVEGRALPIRPAISASLAVGLTTFVFMGPWVGLATAALTMIALGVRRGQVALRVVSVGSLGAAALFIVAKQTRNDYLVDFEWMNSFEVTHAWGLLAAALLAVDPLVELLRRRRCGGRASEQPR